MRSTGDGPSGPTLRRAQIALAVAGAAVAVLAALAVSSVLEGRRPVVVRQIPSAEPEPDWGEHDTLTADPVAGFRPKRSLEVEFPMAALDDSERLTVSKRRDRHGFLRVSDLPDALAGKRVLALGDSHLDGVVSTEDNVTTLLEDALRAASGQEHWVLNAGCGLYTLYQYALRARTLVPLYRPDVVAVFVFCGNDFGELDNVRFPHLDDDLREQPPEPNPPPEDTSRRRESLDLFVEAPFWQGMNQALYLYEQPERREPIRSKARKSVELLEQTARDGGAEVLWVLIPSFDLVFPDKIASASPLAGEVVRSSVQRELHDWFVEVLSLRGSSVVDMLPAFEADGSLGIYAIDFHIFKRGHRLVADRVLPVLRRQLSD